MIGNYHVRFGEQFRKGLTLLFFMVMPGLVGGFGNTKILKLLTSFNNLILTQFYIKKNYNYYLEGIEKKIYNQNEINNYYHSSINNFETLSFSSEIKGYKKEKYLNF